MRGTASSQVIFPACVLLLIAVVGAGATGLWHPRAPSWFVSSESGQYDITVERARQLRSDADSPQVSPLWIDARSEEDFVEGHIDGALLINEEKWADHLWEHRDQLQDGRERVIIVYCDGSRCDRSASVAERLRTELGLSQVWVLKGDWRDL